MLTDSLTVRHRRAPVARGQTGHLVSTNQRVAVGARELDLRVHFRVVRALVEARPFRYDRATHSCGKHGEG